MMIAPMHESDTGSWVVINPDLELEVDAPETAVAGEEFEIEISLLADGDSVTFAEGWDVLMSGFLFDVTPLDENGETTIEITREVTFPLNTTIRVGYLTQDVSVEMLPADPHSIEIRTFQSTQEVGQSVSLQAIVQDEFGNNVADGIDVEFQILRDGQPSDTVSVVNGDSWIAQTENGSALLEYTNTLAGIDTVTAVVDGVDPDNVTDTSVEWRPGPPDNVVLSTDPTTQTVDLDVTLTVEVEDAFGNAVADGTEVAFTIGDSDAGPALNLTGSTTDGSASVSYTRIFPGTDSISASAPAGDPTATSDPVNITWDLPQTAPLTQISASNARGIILDVGVSTTFGTNPSGAVSYRNSPHWVSTRSILSATVDGDHAVVFVEGNVLGVGQQVIRIDLYAGGWNGSTARVRWNGYDSGEFSMSQVLFGR
jgi:hypothetical protein